jgi:hypothetical protein
MNALVIEKETAGNHSCSSLNSSNTVYENIKLNKGTTWPT